jgi:hypothetical protein
MQTENRLFDDFARLAGGALNALSGLKTEVETLVRQQFERLMDNFQFVSREEFEAVQALAVKARADQEDMAARLAAVEARLAALQPGGRAPARTKPRKAKAVAGGEATAG